MRSADVTGSERSCTALAREQRWSKTDLKSKDRGGGWEGEEVDGEETSSGRIPTDDEGASQTHLGI